MGNNWALILATIHFLTMYWQGETFPNCCADGRHKFWTTNPKYKRLLSIHCRLCFIMRWNLAILILQSDIWKNAWIIYSKFWMIQIRAKIMMRRKKQLLN